MDRHADGSMSIEMGSFDIEYAEYVCQERGTAGWLLPDLRRMPPGRDRKVV